MSISLRPANFRDIEILLQAVQMRYGAWLLSASREYHSRGPLKQDLRVHPGSSDFELYDCISFWYTTSDRTPRMDKDLWSLVALLKSRIRG